MGLRRNILISVFLFSNSLMAQTPLISMLLGRQATAATLMTWDPVNFGTNIVISGSNLTSTNSSSTAATAIGNVFHTTGKYYCEITETYTSPGLINGLMKSGYAGSELNTYLGATANGWGMYNNGVGNMYNNNSITDANVTGGTGQTTGLVYCIAWDATGGKLYIGYISGGVNQWFNTGGATTTFASAVNTFGSVVTGTFTLSVGFRNDAYVLNAGQSAYAGAAPSGYTNW